MPRRIGLLFASGLLAQTADAADPKPAPSPPPTPIPVDLAARLGATVRIGDAPNLPIDERVGTSLGLSIFAGLTPRVSLGLSYEHTGLGSERGGLADAERIEVSRSLDLLLAGLRLHLFNREDIHLWA